MVPAMMISVEPHAINGRSSSPSLAALGQGSAVRRPAIFYQFVQQEHAIMPDVIAVVERFGRRSFSFFVSIAIWPDERNDHLGGESTSTSSLK